jgi:ABC-2 type transport system permease protein
MVCLLLLFYTVESLERDRSTGLASIAYAAPVRSASLLFGKALANSLVGVLAIVAAFIACAVAVLLQGKVPLTLTPFVLVWGLLLIPTFVLWTAFVTAVQATLAQRYLTYGIGLGVMALMGYLNATGRLSWVSNWGLWGTVRWSDLGAFEIDGKALLLSRIMALGLAAFFIALSVRAFAREEADAIGIWNRIQPGNLWRSFFRFTPFLVVPLVAGVWLYLAVFDGFAGDKVKKKEKDYWMQNLGTWKDAPGPALVGVDLDLRIDPNQRHLHSRGRFDLANDRTEPLARFALTGGVEWRKVRFTVDGKEYKPKDRSGLYVFEPVPPLPPGGKMAVGFDFEETLPDGISKNGGNVAEFILPSGVVLTGFSQSMAPTVGYDEGIGVDPKENRYEPKIYPPDFYKAKLDPAFTSPSTFTTHIRIDGPADFTFNSVGTRVEEKVEKGRRIAVWQSDYPVRLWNVVGGRWKVKERDNTRIFYFPQHPYNVDEMSEAAAAARRYYSQWFFPYPWRELKISEFPAHAFYAQGFPTDISFSEGIGFLTKSSSKTHLAFMVTAHESAHQWWGNILTPGKGPGGNILSEGMAHFSTLLLLEQVKGLPARIEFAKRVEERYGDRRRVDAERPLVEIDGSKGGDETVTYDKGGWAAWMMLNLLGRDRMLAGLKQFIVEYKDGPDYPVLQDFLATMRRYAPDPAAFDAFADQWYQKVVVPRYRLNDAAKLQLAAPAHSWEVKVKVKNDGTGRMPLEVAATTGADRFTEEGKPGPGYREARTTVTLGAGEEKLVTLRTPFEPKLVLVDPDAKVLQLRRKSAVVKL